MTAVAVAASSDVGHERDGNEDAFGHFEPSDPGDLERKGRVFVLADGMGGAAGGEVASWTAVETVLRTYFEEPFVDPTEALKRSLQLANEIIHSGARERPELSGMGTTCSVLALRQGQAFIAHVGDTRIYLIRESELTRLTNDHSMTRHGAAFAHILTRALGTEPSLQLDLLVSPLPVRDGDIFLLCSDGLWGQLGDRELLDIVGSGRDLAGACREMIDRANARGGSDNITVQLIRIDEGLETREGWLRRLFGRVSIPPPVEPRWTTCLLAGCGRTQTVQKGPGA
jgi:PPM family protein phosphatase